MTTAEQIPTTQCSPLHGVTTPELRDEIAESMRVEGWTGRPLIGYRDDTAHYQLLTGSHRWAAAVVAGLETVPVVILDEATLESLPLNGYGVCNAEDAVVALRDADMSELATLWDEDNQ